MSLDLWTLGFSKNVSFFRNVFLVKNHHFDASPPSSRMTETHNQWSKWNRPGQQICDISKHHGKLMIPRFAKKRYDRKHLIEKSQHVNPLSVCQSFELIPNMWPMIWLKHSMNQIGNHVHATNKHCGEVMVLTFASKRQGKKNFKPNPACQRALNQVLGYCLQWNGSGIWCGGGGVSLTVEFFKHF